MTNKHLTVSEWIRNEVAHGRLPRIRGADDDNTDSSTETKDESSEANPLDALELTDEQRKAFGRVLSAERKKARDNARAEAEAEAVAAADQARKDKEAAEAKEAGKFEEVEAALKADVEAEKAKTKEANDALKALEEKVEAMNVAIDTFSKPSWEALPEPVRKLYQGDPEDALSKLEYLNREEVQELAKANGSTRTGVNPSNPKVGDQSKADAEAARASQSVIYSSAF